MTARIAARRCDATQKPANQGKGAMKDLQRFYMQLASALERTWTPLEDKRHAAILLRNAAIETPHCHFCGNDSKSDLYESRYNPKARICKLCAAEIAEEFKARAAHKALHQPSCDTLTPAGFTSSAPTCQLDRTT
jgi:hypothetical protein